MHRRSSPSLRSARHSPTETRDSRTAADRSARRGPPGPRRKARTAAPPGGPGAITVLRAPHQGARGPVLGNAPPARPSQRDVDPAGKPPNGLRSHQLPADGGADRELPGLDHPVVFAAHVEPVLPHGRQVLVVAPGDLAVGGGEEEGIAYLSVVVAAQEGPADHRTVPAGE